MTLSSRIEIGSNIYQEDWNLLIILDACRVDAIQEVADEYEFINDVQTRWSVGSHSAEWMANTFIQPYHDEVADTTYISGNHHTELVLEQGKFPLSSDEMPPNGRTVPIAWPRWRTVSSSTFAEIDEIWRYWRGEDSSSVLPRPITDTVIRKMRRDSPKRVIAHYMQPHEPYVGSDTHDEPGLLHQLQDSDISRDALWNAYLENLRFVLDDVELLLANADADHVVITADHGEAFGEWGSTGHTISFPHPVVKKVPWVRTSASDSHQYEPSELDENQRNEFDRDALLENLGYV